MRIIDKKDSKKFEVENFGKGVFSNSFIPEGALVWRYSSNRGKEFNAEKEEIEEYLNSLTEEDRNFFIRQSHVYEHQIRISNDIAGTFFPPPKKNTI